MVPALVIGTPAILKESPSIEASILVTVPTDDTSISILLPVSVSVTFAPASSFTMFSVKSLPISLISELGPF